MPFPVLSVSSLVALCLGGVFHPAQGWVLNAAPGVHQKRCCPSPSGLWAASNNNIVLSPSEDADAFDSFKIGTARVHRYARDEDDRAEYLMWYHGRSQQMNSDKSLPPLSTGRIGRAVSKNGLLWEKDTAGSPSEDASDVSLGLNKESWWGFDTAHVGLGQVLLPVSTPAVITEGGVYLMYYMGGNFEESAVVDFLDNVPEAAKNAKIKGMKMRIGVAVSQDGVTWGRVEGDDPSGACMVPYDKQDPNQRDVESMKDDDGKSLLDIPEELYCAWPDVIVNVEGDQGNADKKQPGFFMYYSTMRKEDKQKCIAVAVSADGFRWFKRGVCIEPESDGLDAAGVARCNVIKKAVFENGTWKESGDGFLMFYEGVSKEDNKHRVMMAESKDGRKWTKHPDPVLDVGGEEDAWDFGGVGAPDVIRLDDGSMRMYYTGQAKDGTTAIGVAKLPAGSEATSQWEREQAVIMI